MRTATQPAGGTASDGFWAWTPLPPQWIKELRVLLPAWIATACPPALMLWEREWLDPILLWVLYFVGCVTLACLPFGHEFGCRTVASLLVQPATRRRLFLQKLGLLWAVLASVVWLAVGCGWVGAARDPQAHSLSAVGFWVLASAIVAGCTGPWLTLVTRRTVAGIVSALSLPGLIWAMTYLTLAVMAKCGLFPEASVLPLAPPVYGVAMAIYSVGLAVLGWHKFRSLEDLEVPSGNLALFDRLRRLWPGAVVQARPPGRHPVRALLLKELHLQQWTVAVFGVLLAMLLALVLAKRLFMGMRDTDVPPLAFAFGLILCLLAGSFTCTEERHLGTMDWRVAIPLPTWRQWMIKAGAAAGTAALLGVLLCLVPASVEGLVFWHLPQLPLAVLWWGGVAALWLTSLAALASSLCPTTLRAQITAVALGVASLLAMALLHDLLLIEPGAGPFLAGLFRASGLNGEGLGPVWEGILVAMLWTAAAFVQFCLGFVNYRHETDALRRLPAQGVCVLLVNAAVVVGIAALKARF